METINKPVLEKKIRKSDRRFKFFLYSSVLVFLATIGAVIIYGFVITQRLEAILRRIEETQKGSTCILLIKPDERTKENVTDCIENNRSEDTPKTNDFRFNDNNGKPNKEASIKTANVPEAKQPIQKNIVQNTSLKQEPQETIPQQPKTRAIECRWNTLKLRFEWKYTTDKSWQTPAAQELITSTCTIGVQ